MESKRVSRSTHPDKTHFDLVWPESLREPIRPPMILYLDINHWIGLTRTRLGVDETRRYAALYDILKDPATRFVTRPVLSLTTVVELWYIKDPRQRGALVDTIGELSSFEYLLGPAEIQDHELFASLGKLTARSLFPPPANRAIIAPGMLHAFGLTPGLRIVDKDGADVTADTIRLQGGAGREWFHDLELRAERELLRGPLDGDLPDLVRKGYRPDVYAKSLKNNLEIERGFSKEQLNEHWRRGRLRDVLGARELTLELLDKLTLALLERRMTVGDVVSDLDDIRRLVLSMPHARVTIEIKTHYHRNPQRNWTKNDLHDIRAMANALPYCDIVLTDAEVRSAIRALGLDNLTDTLVPASPNELVEELVRLS